MENSEYNEQGNDPFHELLTSLGFKRVVAESSEKIPNDHKVIVFQSEDDKLLRIIKRWVYKHEKVIILNDGSRDAYEVDNVFAIIVNEKVPENIPKHLKSLKIDPNLDSDFILNLLDEQLKQ